MMLIQNHDSRRHFLQVSTGAGLSFLLPTLDIKATEQRGKERAKSLITLWMNGGPSQLDTWDPHPGTKTGGPVQAIETSIAGIQIASSLPRMAERMQHVALLRSLVSKEGDHERATYFVKTGYRPDPTLKHPALGAIVPHQLGAAGLEIPAYISLGGGQWPGRGGYLGDQYDPFRIFEPGDNLQNLRASASQERQQMRLQGLDVLSRSFEQGRRLQVKQSLHEQTVHQALEMMRSEQLKAFSLEEESTATLQRYGETSFGRGCLVARRLIETGVRSVEVTLNGFDSHANNFEIQQKLALELDAAFSSLLDDLQERDLLTSTIVLCLGEFGRTPRINALEGRDHWPNGFSAVVAGGGLRSGFALGKTDPEGIRVQPEHPLKIQDLYATVLQQLNIDPTRELITPIGRPLALCDGKPIPELLG